MLAAFITDVMCKAQVSSPVTILTKKRIICLVVSLHMFQIANHSESNVLFRQLLW